jgi:hypothetical protein
MMLALLLAVLWLVFGAAGAGGHSSSSGAAPAPATLTQADSGKTVSIPPSGGITLQLSHRWRWSEPRLSGRSVRLQRIDYLVDPGFDAWSVEPVRKGTTTITASGSPGRRFRVTIRVS